MRVLGVGQLRPENVRASLLGLLGGSPLVAGWGASVGEPDVWRGEHAGCFLLARRVVEIGFWCGYVGLPAGHPWYGSTERHGLDGAEVHGGITYGEAELPLGERVDWCCWYVGFDCSHAGDFSPGTMRTEPGVDPRATATRLLASGEGGVYRTLDYVQAELRSLAEQAQAAYRRAHPGVP